MKRRVSLLIGMMLAVLGLVGGTASAAPTATPANASDTAAASDAVAACNSWIVRDPVILSGTLLYAGYTFCSNYAAGYEGTLQRKTTFGWKTLDSVEFRAVAGQTYFGSLQSDCDGSGTKTYRHYSRAQNALGQWQYKYSREVRLTC